jgi:hypothetical protein
VSECAAVALPPFTNGFEETMPAESVPIAHFDMLPEAQLALSRLREAGLNAVLTGEEAATMLPGMLARIEIRVPLHQAQRAAFLLATLEQESTLDPDWEERAAATDGYWVCTLCDTCVSQEQEICPTCATPRESIQEENEEISSRPESSSRPPPASDRVTKAGEVVHLPDPPVVEEPEEDLEIPNLDNFLIDDLARRALRATLFSIVCWPAIFYALWLQYQLYGGSVPLSPLAARNRSLCLLLDFLLLSPILLSCLFFGPLSRVAHLFP